MTGDSTPVSRAEFWEALERLVARARANGVSVPGSYDVDDGERRLEVLITEVVRDGGSRTDGGR